MNGKVSYHLQILFDDGIYRCIKGMLNMGHFLSFGHSQEPEYNRGQLSVALQESTSVLPEKESVLCSTKVQYFGQAECYTNVGSRRQHGAMQ